MARLIETGQENKHTGKIARDIHAAKDETLEIGALSQQDRKLVRQCALFDGFEDQELNLLIEGLPCFFKEYKAKQPVVWLGEQIKNIGILLEGGLASKHFYQDGKAQSIKLYEPLDIVGLETVTSRRGTTPHVILAGSLCRILWMPYGTLLERCRQKTLWKDRLIENILAIYADEMIRMSYKAYILSRRTVRERILAYLQLVVEKRGSRTIELSMTHMAFAEYLCVTRSSLTLELGRLRKEKIIVIHGRKVTLRE
jgi:CRP-like cAMP-binding protein